MAASNLALQWTEKGMLPDAVVRAGIRRLLRQRLDEIGADDAARGAALSEAFVAALRDAPVALLTDKANEQHYELPPAFFGAVLGPHRKYSSLLVARRRQAPRRTPRLRRCKLPANAPSSPTARTCSSSAAAGARSRLWMAERYPRSRDHRRVELACAARIHRGRGARARPRQRRVSPATSTASRPTSASIAWSRSRCSSTCATGRARFAASPAGCARRPLLHARLRASRDAVCVRGRATPATG